MRNTFIVLAVVSVVFISGCTSGSKNSERSGLVDSISNAISGKSNCDSMGTGITKKECNEKCIKNNLVPGNHKSQNNIGEANGFIQQYTTYDCFCCEGDVKKLGCTYETANMWASSWGDDEILKSDCKSTCESNGFNVGEPEKENRGGLFVWACRCYKCDEKVKKDGYKKCYKSFTLENEITHCFFENGTKVRYPYTSQKSIEVPFSDISTPEPSPTTTATSPPPPSPSPTPDLSLIKGIYDDFSSPELNQFKFSETPWGSPEESGISKQEQSYHIKFSSGYSIILAMKRYMKAGETLDFDINYVNGTNNLVYFKINSVDFNDLIGRIQIGLNHINVKFEKDKVTFTLTEPDGDKLELVSQQENRTEYEFGVVTGHNNPPTPVHIDFDNFVIG